MNASRILTQHRASLGAKEHHGIEPFRLRIPRSVSGGASGYSRRWHGRLPVELCSGARGTFSGLAQSRLAVPGFFRRTAIGTISGLLMYRADPPGVTLCACTLRKQCRWNRSSVRTIRRCPCHESQSEKQRFSRRIEELLPVIQSSCRLSSRQTDVLEWDRP